METLAVMGPSLAALSAARAARAQGFTGRLVIVGDEPHRPSDRPPLSRDFLPGALTAEDLCLECDTDDLQAEWLLDGGAAVLDASTLAIALRDGTTVQADAIVIPTGASVRQLPVLAGMANVYTLRTLADAQSVASELVSGNRMAVIGAGSLGAEVASSAVVEKFDSDDGKVTGLQLLGGGHVLADVVVVGIGAEPNRGWLAGLGLEPGAGIICDATGCTDIPGLVAVDDCAAWFDPAAGTHRRVEHWTGALERAALAVRALLDPGGPEEPINLPTSGPAGTPSSCSSRDTPPVTTASRSRRATRRPAASLPLAAATGSPWLSSA